MTPPARPLEIGYDVMRRVGAVVLGGGRGTRLYPLTAVRAKPAVPLVGRYRLVDVPLSNCLHSDIYRIMVLTQFNSHSLNRHINNAWHFDRITKGFVEVLAAEQTNESGDWFQGTADAVRKSLRHLRNLRCEYYIILSGDQLYRMDYREMMETHLRKGADVTVSALPVSRRDAKGFGVMQLQKSGRIKDFVEKPKEDSVLDGLVTPESLFDEFGLNAKGKPYLASMGVYMFNADVLEHVLLEHPQWIDFGKEIIPNSLKDLKVFAHMFDGFWEDIGTVRSYFETSMAMCKPNRPFEFHDEYQQIYTHNRSLPGVQIHNATINDCIICEGTQVNSAKIDTAILGVRQMVWKGAEIKNAILLGAEAFESQADCKGRVPMGIGENAKISEAIVDHNARIGKNVVIRGDKKLKDYDGEGYAIRDGIVIVYKNAVIPDGAQIGAVS